MTFREQHEEIMREVELLHDAQRRIEALAKHLERLQAEALFEIAAIRKHADRKRAL